MATYCSGNNNPHYCYLRCYTLSMHSAGLELTKLTYTRLEDNLIRHRGDRSYTITTPLLHYF